MGFKQRKPFILHDKEAARKEYEFSKLLTMSLIFSALIIPLINDFFLSFLHRYYVSGDYALIALDVVLSYFIPAVAMMATYFAYSAVVISIYKYGVKGSFFRIFLLLAGVVFSYLLQYLCTCVVNGYVIFDISDENSFLALVSSFVITVFVFSKNIVLVLYTHLVLKKMRSQGGTVWIAPAKDGSVRKFKSFMSSAVAAGCANRKISVQFFAVSLVCDLIARTVSSFMEIASAGAPEEFSHYLYFAEQYALVILNNLLGLFIMLVSGAILGKYIALQEKTK